MENTAERLKHLLRTVPEQFGRMSEAEASERPVPGKWSPKEALGHLCDSAVNNLPRFIKIQYEKQPYVLIPYDQDQWVTLQDYQEAPAEEILNLWSRLNNRILKAIEKIPAEKLHTHVSPPIRKRRACSGSLTITWNIWNTIWAVKF
ncbi:DinB family protein [Paenibacillus tyrfis]|uniref:DinB family protein n=1 Tax=Paenibacillus tyrfis TaxID=1501230 RepID=UPI00209F93A5|nr:DinB family protein [Paenibacillus tyrfis]MCP1306342.1 DinB family protein [Paenibacillus tyrfis]